MLRNLGRVVAAVLVSATVSAALVAVAAVVDAPAAEALEVPQLGRVAAFTGASDGCWCLPARAELAPIAELGDDVRLGA